ncbi:bifunctional alpha/beta hydrolase/OsmC family protein [Coralliovum pocilloporae]|uniref:bifunctional alpha/beta hydrolase/OsmC family protein n=1 Tax=Coralliovum pocilloporae TaxID=3066369 RepID=UPI003307171A
MAEIVQRISFEGGLGETLAARLHVPSGTVRAYALFAHCFTCTKDILAAKKIADELAKRGIALMRFDFSGLGQSGGDFAETSFTSNVGDILAAADYLRQNYEAPAVLIGHSLGGAATLAAAGDIPEARAVATIGAPSEADHVIHNFAAHLDEIEHSGEAEVSLAGRPFTIRKDFVEDLRAQSVTERVATMKKPLMVLHSPIDDTVSIDNARDIFTAAKHPKSFVSLDNADHLLSRAEDIAYAAEMIAAWASRYIAQAEDERQEPETTDVHISETQEGKFQNYVRAGRHLLLADEPKNVGGLDSGPSPYDFVSIALGACTSMTLRMYADFKKLPVKKIAVDVDHAKVHASDCAECGDMEGGKGGKIDRFERIISITGDIDEATREKMLSIADRCPVHKTLEHSAAVVTRLKS